MKIATRSGLPHWNQGSQFTEAQIHGGKTHVGEGRVTSNGLEVPDLWRVDNVM